MKRWRMSAVPRLSVAALLVVSTEWFFFQRLLTTQSLTYDQWLGAAGLALVMLVVIEVEKAIRRSRSDRDTVESQDPVVVITGTGSKAA